MGLFLFCLVLLMIFELWDHFSPLPAHDWIATNLQKIQTRDPNDFSFAVFGDNKNSHTTFERLLQQVDHERDVAFAIDLGDLVYDGEKQKYRYFFNQVRSNLTLPLLTAIGNHELRENGRGLYCESFGPFFYSFQIGRNYFMVLDDAEERGIFGSGALRLRIASLRQEAKNSWPSASSPPQADAPPTSIRVGEERLFRISRVISAVLEGRNTIPDN